jgi:NTP pyrophosphatase (non-canonical NTP hydrolase)
MKVEYDELQDRINMLFGKKNVLIEKYNELKEENEELRAKLEFIEQGQPHPCTFDGRRSTNEYTFRDWHTKLLEEVAEVEVEVNKLEAKGKHHIDDITEEEDIENLTEELHDVITLATSELDYLQWSIYGRLQKQKGVNEKNRKRGYWK